LEEGPFPHFVVVNFAAVGSYVSDFAFNFETVFAVPEDGLAKFVVMDFDMVLA